MCGPVRANPGSRVEKIVVAGGWNVEMSDVVEVYDISSNTWETGLSVCVCVKFKSQL